VATAMEAGEAGATAAEGRTAAVAPEAAAAWGGLTAVEVGTEVRRAARPAGSWAAAAMAVPAAQDLAEVWWAAVAQVEASMEEAGMGGAAATAVEARAAAAAARAAEEGIGVYRVAHLAGRWAVVVMVVAAAK